MTTQGFPPYVSQHQCLDTESRYTHVMVLSHQARRAALSAVHYMPADPVTRMKAAQCIFSLTCAAESAARLLDGECIETSFKKGMYHPLHGGLT